MRRRSTEDWRKAVYSSPALKDSARVVLLVLADYMKTNLQVSVPRKRLAAMLGRSERRISARITEAHAAGFLDTVVRGHKGTTAVYIATFPDAHSGTVCSPLYAPKSDETCPPMSRDSGTHGGPTSSKNNQPETVAVYVGTGHNEKRSNEEEFG